MKSATKYVALIAVCALFLNGCGGGSYSSSTGAATPAATSQGVFLDSAVEGMRYVSGSLSGYTGSDGRFGYETGQSVSFYVGDILIGEATGEAVVTPADLVPGATDQTHPTVSNICQFIQSPDDDGDWSNGITITRIQDALAEGRTVSRSLPSPATAMC